MPADENVAVVREMWAAYERDGLAAITAFAHPEAHWQPHSAGGRTFTSTEEYRAHVAAAATAGVRVESRLLGLWAHEDVVAVRGRIRVRRGGEIVDDTRIYWVHRFRDGRIEWTASSPDLGHLLEQAGYPDDRLAGDALVRLSRG